jgi:Gas vesicle synthesis protein GvpL/GvpF
MTRSNTRSKKAKKQSGKAESSAGIYVYGIVPADVEVEKEAKGIGDPPRKVEVIREGDIAALVSSVAVDAPIGKPEDLQAHARLLDGTASVAPVLPLRFGAVMSDADAVASELLRSNHDEFARALGELEGRAQYIVKGRYDANAILSEVLSESEQARDLREDIRDKPEDAARNSRMVLGELVANAIEAKRGVDTKTVVDEIGGFASQVNVRQPTHEFDAVHVALLAEVDRQGDLEAIVEKLAENWNGRVEFRLLGPLAAYDFVVTSKGKG